MEIKCLRLNDMTESVCDSNMKVKYLLPGETAHFVNRKNKIIHETDIISASPNRTKVVCPIFYECGGCDFLHISYEEQLKMKAWQVRDLCIKSNIKTEFLPIISSDKPRHYRHKVVASATESKGKLRFGLYQEGTKHVIPFTNCFIQDQTANKIIVSLENLFNKYKIKAYDMDKKLGMIKHVLLRKSYHYQNFLVCIVTQGNLLPNAKKIAQELVQLHPEVQTVVQNIHHKQTSFVLLDEEKIIYGSGYILDAIGDIRFRLSAKSFYQVNPYQMIKLYQSALDAAEIKPTDVVLDTYSGIGTISLLAAKKAREVIAIESNASAHLDAVFNRKLNQIQNVRFIQGDVEQAILNLNQAIDVLILDPTRDGASEKFLETVMLLKPKRIVYISCEPKTQVRDLKLLSRLYQVKHIQPVDMFSQSAHIESIAVLKINN